jgi:hypothetical protein
MRWKMNRLSWIGLLICALGCASPSAFAENSIDVSVLPIISGGGFLQPQPLKILLNNSGEQAVGTLTVGSPEQRIDVPFQIGAGKSLALTVICPTYDPMEGQTPSAQVADHFVDVYLNTKTGSNLSQHSKQTFRTPTGTYKFLFVTDATVPVDFLTFQTAARSLKENSKSKAFPKTAKYGLSHREFAVLRPRDALERSSVYRRLSLIVLGAGTRWLSSPAVSAFREYVLQGGILVFCSSPTSAASDPRWRDLMPSSGKSRYFGFGSLVHLDFDVRAVDRENEALRNKFLMAVNAPINAYPAQNLDSDIQTQVNQENEQGPASKADPFSSTLPSLTTLAVSLVAYFLLAIPINLWVLRRLQKPELMWITAPLLAIGFASLIFRGSDKLANSPRSVDAEGYLIDSPDASKDIQSVQFGIFSPKAGTFGFHLSNTENFSLANFAGGFGSSPFGLHISIPVVLDTGTLDVPNYHSTSLQFRDFALLQDPPKREMIHFSVGQPIHRFYPLIAKNVSARTIRDVYFVAGENSSTGRSLLPGESIKLMVDRVRPISKDAFFEFDKQASDKQDQDRHGFTPPDPHQNIEKFSMEAAAMNQVVLFGRIDDLPVGPNLSGPVNFHSAMQIAAFAPLSLKIP